MKQSLQQKGLAFNETDPAPLRETLRKAGFYNEWRGRYGDAAWAVLEQFSGKPT
jgi:TRAP-type transport system periplasmic protein